MAQWITRLPTEQKIPGSNPGALDSFLIERREEKIVGIITILYCGVAQGDRDKSSFPETVFVLMILLRFRYTCYGFFCHLRFYLLMLVRDGALNVDRLCE